MPIAMRPDKTFEYRLKHDDPDQPVFILQYLDSATWIDLSEFMDSLEAGKTKASQIVRELATLIAKALVGVRYPDGRVENPDLLKLVTPSEMTGLAWALLEHTSLRIEDKKKSESPVSSYTESSVKDVEPAPA